MKWTRRRQITAEKEKKKLEMSYLGLHKRYVYKYTYKSVWYKCMRDM